MFPYLVDKIFEGFYPKLIDIVDEIDTWTFDSFCIVDEVFQVAL